MNATDLIHHCQSVGIRLEARGDRLHVEATVGSITPEIQQELTSLKPDLMALFVMRARLRSIASSLGVPRTIVDQLPPDELEAIAEQSASYTNYLDSEGDPLALTALGFYLCGLADKART